MTLLLSFGTLHTVKNRRELADYAGLSVGSLSRSLQKLLSRDLIKLTEIRVKNSASETDIKNAERSARGGLSSLKPSEKYLQIKLLPAAKPILAALTAARNDYDSARFSDFSEEELAAYAALTEKIKQNTLKVLLP